MRNKAWLLLPFLLILNNNSFSQDDPEFPKGFIMHAKLHNGMITTFHAGADLFVGGFQLIPQFTIVPQKLRAGVIAGVFYASQQWQAAAGPTLSLKLKTINAGAFGSAANIHLTLDHLWGTRKQQMLGGGIHLDLLNKLTLGPTVHRDYKLNTWWFQFALGLRISKKEKVTEPFNN